MFPVFFREMLVFGRRLKGSGYVFSALVTPLLYLLTFGMGLGRGMSMSGVSYLLFVIPGICAMSTMTNAYNGVAVSISVGRLHFKSFELFLTSPIAYWEIVLGEVLAGAVRGLFASAFVLIAGALLGAHLPASPVFYIAWMLTALLFSCTGVIAGFWASSHEDTSQFSNFFIMPMAFFCGTFFAIDKLPVFLRVPLHFLPLTHATKAMRAGFTGNDVSFAWLAVLAGFIAVLFAVALVMVHRSRN
jgi:ABC-2 type transport system permease protein